MSPRPPRRGVILLVVLVLLTIFALVGITFVFLSDSEATKAKHGLDSEIKPRPDVDLVLSSFLSQFMFDTNKADSAIRTHGLSSGMYGANGNTPYSSAGRQRGVDPLSNPICILHKEDLPNFQNPYFIGPPPRTYSETIYGPLGVPYTYPDHNNFYLGAFDSGQQVLRRSYMRGPIRLLRPGDGVTILFDPFDTRMPTTPPNDPGFNTPNHRPFFTFWRPNFTGDPRLGWINAGTPLATYRPPQPTPSGGATWLDLTAAQARAMVMRPGPWDHPNFPPPDDYAGDVKNLTAGMHVPGIGVPRAPTGATDPAVTPMPWYGNDSIWLDLGFPMQIGADGRRYKPLFAVFVTDLDNRINLNATGNIWGTFGGSPGFSTSHEGWGPWEINPFRLLNYPPPLGPPGAGPTEGIQVFQGTTTVPVVQGKYGSSVVGGAVPTPPAGHYMLWPRRVPYFSAFDPDGARETLLYSPSDPFRLPGYDANLYDTWNYDRFPRYVTKGFAMPPVPSVPLGYGSGVVNLVGNDENRKIVGPVPHMLSHTYFAPQGPNAVFPVSNMDALLRHGDTGADSLTSDFRRLLINNMTAVRLRRQVTAHSADLERAGAIPYWNDAQPLYQLPAAGPTPYDLPPSGPAQTYPTLPIPANSEFTSTWKSLAATLYSRLDLNRPLPEYPIPNVPNTVTITPPGGGVPPTLEIGARIGDTNAFMQAQLARQDLARDIFNRLLAVTGADAGLPSAAMPIPPPPPIPPARVNALRYLAQLAVNIVDFRDLDDYNTPWNWGQDLTLAYASKIPPQFLDPALAGEWVFGTELPRLVVNEAYAQFADPGTSATATINVWVELYNPMHRDQAHEFERDERFQPAYGYPAYSSLMPGNGQRLYMPADTTTGAPGYPVYRLILGNDATGGALRTLNNANGQVPPPNQRMQSGGAGPCVVGDWFNSMPPPDWNPTTLPNTDYVHPANDNVSGARKVTPSGTVDFITAPDKGFFLLGPMTTFPVGMAPSPMQVVTASLQRPEMTYEVPAASAGDRTTVILQRLACPHLPAQPDPMLPLYNPYVTVDYMEGMEPVSDMTPIAARHSVGRTQPYAARISRTAAGAVAPWPTQALVKQQTPDPDPPSGMRMDQVQHTFLRINCTEEVNYVPAADRDPLIIDYNDDGVPEAPDQSTRTSATPLPPQTLLGSRRNTTVMPETNTLPLDWLKHLDRDLISPLELLHVSGYKPHELTQQFMVDRITNGLIGGVDQIGAASTADLNETFQHVVDWFDKRTIPVGVNSNRLYRVFDYLQTRSRMAGTSQITFQATAAPGAVPGLYLVTLVNGSTAWNRPAALPAGPAVNGGLWEITVGSCVAVNGLPAPPVVPDKVVRVVAGPPVPNPDTQFWAYFPPQDFPPALLTSLPFNLSTTYVSGRLPGKLNINTITDIEVWRALCDASPANAFNPPLNVSAWGAGALTIPPGSATSPVAGTLVGMSHGVGWTISAGTQIEFNDPINGRETVTVTGVAGMDPGPYTVAYTPLQLTHSGMFPITIDNVTALYALMTASRDGTGIIPPRPFVGFSAGLTSTGTQYPNGFSIADTLVRPRDPLAAPTGPRLFEIDNGVHPQRHHELLEKLANNITTRSNVFAVWLTVGYFEVTPLDLNADGTPDFFSLGQEIGRADGRHVRHRMFAIVDRTNFDPYVQQMDYWVRNVTFGDYSYDVSLGAYRDSALPPSLWQPTNNNVVIPIVGNNLFDPRRPYVALVEFQNTMTGAIRRSPAIALPPTVLYWSVIE